MDRFQAMQVFTRVVDANSFTLAADSLGLPRSTVTTTIQSLERSLKLRLNRTTRRLSLTPDGAAYYERCVQILADIEDMDASFRDVTRGTSGRLRIDTPPSIRSEEHTSELQSLMRISSTVFCLKKSKRKQKRRNMGKHTTPLTKLLVTSYDAVHIKK